MQGDETVARAPLVFKLGGEYSVLTGGIGMAAAADTFAEARVIGSVTKDLAIVLPDIKEGSGMSISQKFTEDRLNSLYQSFNANKCMDPREGKEGIKRFKSENSDIDERILPFAAIAAWLSGEHKVQVIGTQATIGFGTEEGRIRSGMASSAAVSTAFTVAMVKEYGAARLSDDEMINAARIGDRIIHGSPTAGRMDVGASYHGGVISVSNDVVRQESFRMPSDITIMLVYSGQKGDTGGYVDKVLDAMKDPDRGKPTLLVLDTIGTVSLNMLRAFAQRDVQEVGRAMFETHNALRSLGVVVGVEIATPRLDQAVELARKTGAIGAKLSGSGGGGWAVVVTKQPIILATAFQNQGFEAPKFVSISELGAKHYLREEHRIKSRATA